jgi:hypothetical protein
LNSGGKTFVRGGTMGGDIPASRDPDAGGARRGLGASSSSSRDDDDYDAPRGLGLGASSGLGSGSGSSTTSVAKKPMTFTKGAPLFQKAGAAAAPKKSLGFDKPVAFSASSAPPPPPPVPAKKSKKADKKRDIDLFLEEMKRADQDRGSSKGKGGFSSSAAPIESASDKGGHHDTGDPNTTNIYCGNMASEVTDPFPFSFSCFSRHVSHH